MVIDEAQVHEDERDGRRQLLGLYEREPVAEAGDADMQRDHASPQRDAQAGQAEGDGHLLLAEGNRDTDRGNGGHRQRGRPGAGGAHHGERVHRRAGRDGE